MLDGQVLVCVEEAKFYMLLVKDNTKTLGKIYEIYIRIRWQLVLLVIYITFTHNLIDQTFVKNCLGEI